MPWTSVSCEVASAAAEAFGDALLEAGAQSVAQEGARLCALFDSRADAHALIAQAARAAAIPAPAIALEHVADQDWVRATQAQFAPLAIGRLWIGASWHEPPKGRAVVRIDPGLAFGTGSHPSTRLALRYLEKHMRGGERVLDYGCGSGILAIAAARLGASHVDAVDVDPQAVETTASNAAANRVVVNAAPTEMLTAATYDLVVSNILSQTLIVLAPLLAARVARGGRLALSGILASQAAEVAQAYAGAFDAAVVADEEGWALVAGTRR